VNLTAFAGTFLKKHYLSPLQPMLHYIINNLTTHTLSLLEEILVKMTGFEKVESLNEGQIQGNFYIQYN